MKAQPRKKGRRLLRGHDESEEQSEEETVFVIKDGKKIKLKKGAKKPNTSTNVDPDGKTREPMKFVY